MERNIVEYVGINHHLMTVKEMSEEAGEADYQIRNICKRNGWTPISEADRIRDLIIANAGGIIEEIAEKAGCGTANIYKVAKDLGVEVVSRKHAAATSQLPVMQNPIKYSFMHHAFKDVDKDALQEQKNILLRTDPTIKRVKDVYNQSTSPFGLADQLKDIQTQKAAITRP